MTGWRFNPSVGVPVNGQIEPSTTPQMVVAANARLELAYRNVWVVPVYVGPTSAVTVETGWPMTYGDQITDTIGAGALWVIATATGGDLRWWETRLS